MENNTVQAKKPIYKSKWFIFLTIFVAIIIIAFIFNAIKGGGERINWTSLTLSSKLPEPPKLNGEISSNSSESLSLTLYKISPKDFNEYVQNCKNAGYTVDITNEILNIMYEAFNEEGYKLYLSYYESEKTMKINLNEPETAKMKDIEWPESGLCSLLPAPKSNFGYFYNNSSNYLYVVIGNTTPDDYEDYVKACQDNGFNVDYNNSNNNFSAENSDGNKLYLNYAGVNVMKITLHASSENTDDTTDTNSTTTDKDTTSSTEEVIEEKQNQPTTPKDENNSSSNNKIGSDFKTAMDDYEDFMDDYIEFMNKYQNSDGTDMSLLSEYSEYMSKYSKVCEDFAAWEDRDLNSAETAYYVEVQTRVNQKLLNSLN